MDEWIINENSIDRPVKIIFDNYKMYQTDGDHERLITYIEKTKEFEKHPARFLEQFGINLNIFQKIYLWIRIKMIKR